MSLRSIFLTSLFAKAMFSGKAAAKVGEAVIVSSLDLVGLRTTETSSELLRD